MSKKHIVALFSIAAISFALNMLWENAQALLYEGYAGPVQHLKVCFVASLGDVAIIIFLYALLAVITYNAFWFKNLNRRLILVVIIIGAIIGVIIEKWALLSNGWSYARSMPIIPLVEVGLVPVLQMMILPILTFYFSSSIIKKASLLFN